MWLFKNAGNVVGVSKKICSEYQMRTGEKLLNIPPLMPFIPAIESKDVIRRRWNIGDEHVFLSVGSLKELKNPFTVIEAAKHLGESFLKNNKICFFIAGDGGLKSSMLQKIKLYSLDAYFILSGNVEQSEISSIYKMADSYVISSKFEGTPLSLMDAMSNELNIIASNAPGINDMIFDEENGMLFEIDNYKDLSLKIKRHVGVGCVHYGSAAKRDYNNKYNYQDMLDQYLKILSL